MKLKLSTDYALRIVLYIAMKEEAVSLKEISEKLIISQYYVSKFCKKLHDAEIVNIHYGLQEEFSLAKSPNEITMFDIINTMENSIKINLCLDEGEYCSGFRTKRCSVRDFYCNLQNNIETSLKGKTIQDLLEDEVHIDS